MFLLHNRLSPDSILVQSAFLVETPVCAFLEFLLIVFTPFGDARRTGPINIMIRIGLAFVLSTPTGLGGIFGVVYPTVRADQVQEGRRIPFTHPGAPHAFTRIYIAERAVVIADVLVDPGEIRNGIMAAEHPLISLFRF